VIVSFHSPDGREAEARLGRERMVPMPPRQGERRILAKYATYYNGLRTHRSLNKDAPIRRAIQHVGRIVSAPVLGGLHHHYCRI
jgi:hypothetical protein